MQSVESGTQTATLSTEHTIGTSTGIGIYVLVVDTNEMASGDTLTIRMKTKVLSGGTMRLADEVVLTGAQAVPNKYSVPIPSDVEIFCSIEQTTGTVRAYPWKLLRA